MKRLIPTNHLYYISAHFIFSSSFPTESTTANCGGKVLSKANRERKWLWYYDLVCVSWFHWQRINSGVSQWSCVQLCYGFFPDRRWEFFLKKSQEKTGALNKCVLWHMKLFRKISHTFVRIWLSASQHKYVVSHIIRSENNFVACGRKGWVHLLQKNRKVLKCEGTLVWLLLSIQKRAETSSFSSPPPVNSFIQLPFSLTLFRPFFWLVDKKQLLFKWLETRLETET